jgi:hypothetical protein
MSPLVIPNAGSGASAELLAQAAPDTVDITLLDSGGAGIGVISGCGVSAQASPNATVKSAAGMVSVGNAGYLVPSVSSLTIAANASGNPRFDLVLYRVGTGVMVLQGTAAVSPFTAFPAPTFTTDVVLAAIYVASGFSTITNAEIVSKGASIQPSPLGASPTMGAKVVGMGHSLMAGYGAIPTTHAWLSQLAGMMRARLWNQAVNGAILGALFAAGVGGYGGIAQILQQYLPPTGQPINWLGAYSGTPYYSRDDGVTFSPAGISCTTAGTTALTSAALFTAGVYVAGMVLSGTNITPGTYVVSVNSTSSLTMSQVASGSGTQTLTFTGWYRAMNEVHAVSPAGVGVAGFWTLVPAGNVQYFGGSWNSASNLPILMFGNNDVGAFAQRNPQPFLSAFQAMCCRVAAALVWEDDATALITYAGGTWTKSTMVALTAAFGSGLSITAVPNTAAATLGFFTPPDWPGGFIDLGFVIGGNVTTTTTGALNFTVDGSNVNCKCSGMADGPLVNFGSPMRSAIFCSHLTVPLTSGVASGTTLTVSPLVAAVASGDTIVIGGVNGGTSQTYITTAGSAAQATTLTVTSQTANATYPVGTPFYDSKFPAGWPLFNDMVVRVPVPAGVHQVVGTVQASPAVVNLWFDYASFEALNAPIALVFGLWKVLSSSLWNSAPTDQDIDIWNTALSGVLGAGNEWPHVFVNIGDIFKNSSPLSTALTLGQTAVTSLVLSAGVKVAIASGDQVMIGSGATSQIVTASSAAAVGVTTIAVTSFTSTFAQPIGTPVCDYTVASKLFYQDGVHPNVTGHSVLAATAWQVVLNGLQTIPQLVAVQSAEVGRPTSVSNTASGTDIVVGSATVAAAWVIVGAGTCSVPAEPGDILELDVNALWDTSAAVIGSLDLVTMNASAYTAGNNAGVAAVINYVSGVASMGGGVASIGLGFLSAIDAQAVGAQAANGLSALYSPGAVATVSDRIVGKFYYPVQAADIINGVVTVALVGRSSTTTVRHIKNAAGYQVFLSAVNVGPLSYLSEA